MSYTPTLKEELEEQLTDFEFAGRILHEKQVEAIIAVILPIIERETATTYPAIREDIAAEVLAGLDEALHRRITHDWLILLGYDSASVHSLPDTTEHEVAGCEATTHGYDCTNEAGESRHPFADEADRTAEIVGFTLGRVRLALSTAKEATKHE